MHDHHAVSSRTLDPDPRYITPSSTSPFPSLRGVWLINSTNSPWGYLRPGVGIGLECNDPIELEFTVEEVESNVELKRNGIRDGSFKRWKFDITSLPSFREGEEL
jgi:hypothetical protein